MPDHEPIAAATPDQQSVATTTPLDAATPAGDSGGALDAHHLDDLIGYWAAATPDEPALVFDDRTWSFAELADLITSWATLVTEATGPGDRVAVLSDNRPEMVALLYAVPAAGRVLVPLNSRHAPAELAEQLARSGATLLLGSTDLLAALAPALHADIPTIDLDLPAAQGPRSVTDRRTGAEDDVAWIIFTSGTTGRPKGALLTHASLLAAVRATAGGRPLADDEVYLYPFPLFHVSAYNVLHAHARGRPVVLLARFVAAQVLALTARHRVTAMSLAPTMVRLLLDETGGRPDARLATLRTVAYGAAPMPATLLADANAALDCDFAQGYGMTELSGNAVFLSPADHRAALAGDERLGRAAGRAAPGVEVRTVDDDGAAVPVGEPGEIVVRAGQVCAGYLDDPAATAEAIRDGWLHTGDVGVLDADGLLTIVDRAKDVVVTGGENVASREVEDVALSHPVVAQVAVIGLPDDRWGEAVTAVVVPAADATPEDLASLTESLRAHVGAQLAGYKKPRRVVLVDVLPVNAGGKVDKRALRQRLGEQPGA